MSLGGREFVSNAGVQDLARDSSQGVWDVAGEAQKVVLVVFCTSLSKKLQIQQ